jgi:hypothetical protein
MWVLAPASTDLSIGAGGNFAAASAGAGLRLAFVNAFTADLSVARAIHGPRDDTRYFFILGAKY